MERIPASERTREKLKALTQGRGEVEDGRSELVRLAVRRIIEEALEGEARDAVGANTMPAAPSPAPDIATAIARAASRVRRAQPRTAPRRSLIGTSRFGRFGRRCMAAPRS